MPALRPCPVVGCPALTAGGRCPEHRREVEQSRGTRQQRGYDARHDALRRMAARRVRSGRVLCWRCGEPIRPGEPFDLGHDDHDRTVYRGPEHEHCNRSAGGRSAHE